MGPFGERCVDALGVRGIRVHRTMTDYARTAAGAFSRAQSGSAEQDLCAMQASIRMAKEVGKRLGEREVLLEEVCRGGETGAP